MPNLNSMTPDSLRQMESILEDLNQGVFIVFDQQAATTFSGGSLRVDNQSTWIVPEVSGPPTMRLASLEFANLRTHQNQPTLRGQSHA